MTQGQGEGKVKLHTMNLIAASSHLTDMGFVCVTLPLSLTVPFPSFQVGKKGEKFHGILVNSVVHMGQDRDSQKISGPWEKCCVKP